MILNRYIFFVSSSSSRSIIGGGTTPPQLMAGISKALVAIQGDEQGPMQHVVAILIGEVNTVDFATTVSDVTTTIVVCVNAGGVAVDSPDVRPDLAALQMRDSFASLRRAITLLERRDAVVNAAIEETERRAVNLELRIEAAEARIAALEP